VGFIEARVYEVGFLGVCKPRAQEPKPRAQGQEPYSRSAQAPKIPNRNCKKILFLDRTGQVGWVGGSNVNVAGDGVDAGQALCYFFLVTCKQPFADNLPAERSKSNQIFFCQTKYFDCGKNSQFWP
jgi:hypothetical protein